MSEAAPRPSAAAILLLLSLVSGLGGVVYEVLYMRELTPVLGDMFYVHVSLLGVFLLGNGIGAALAHRFLDHLFAFELLTGFYALSLPALLGLYVASPLAHAFESPVAQTLFASALLIAPPALCVGFSIPLFSAYVQAQGRIRDGFKLTYALYNVGAALSVLVVEFWLIRRIGISGSLYVVAGANLVCGALLLALRDHYLPPSREAPTPSAGFGWRRGSALVVASTAAAAFLGFYIKVCYHLFLPHRENFAICTALSVLAISLGTALVRRWGLGFAAALSLAGLTLVPIFAGFGGIARTFHALEQSRTGPTTLSLTILVGFLLVIPYVFLGATIPALLGREEDVARRSGRALLLCGLGNVVGLVGFTLIAHPGLPMFSIPVVIWGMLVLAVLLHGGVSRRHVLALGASALLVPVLQRQSETLVYLVSWPPPIGAEVTHFKVASDNVSYVNAPEIAYVVYNGHPSVIVQQDGHWNRAEIVSGIVPALVAPSLDDALVLGLGTGFTAGTAAVLFDRTDVVEINSAFFEVARLLREGNSGVLWNSSARIHHDDARRFLSKPPRRYDAIVNSIPAPTYFSAGKIYTTEFFDMVESALKPGGVFSSWFAVGDMSPAGLKTLLATISAHFAHCNLAVLHGAYYFMSCSHAPISIRDPEELALPTSLRTLLRKQLRGVSVEDYLRNLFVSDNVFGRLELADVPINTDDFPVLEFQVSRFDRKRRDSGGTPSDPISTDPGLFNVVLPVGDDGGASMTRAVVLAQARSELFERFYGAWIDADESRRERFRTRLGVAPDAP